jgi:lipooligosaccharide transport system permease protein
MSVAIEPVRRLDVSVKGAARYWLRNVAIFKRTYRFALLAWFIEPLFYLFAMGFGLGKYLASIHGVKYIDFIAPGLVAVSAMWGATFESTWRAFFKMAEARIYDACVATPLSFEDVALGESAWSMTQATIYGTIFLAVAVMFGVFHSWWGILAPLGLMLIGLNFALTGLSYAYLAKQSEYLAYYWTLYLTPMFMFSGVFFPLDRLPGWLQTIAWFMPLRHGANLMRALLLTGDMAAAGRAALWLIVVDLALIPVPMVLLRRRLAR